MNGQGVHSIKVALILIELYQTMKYNAISYSIPQCTSKSIANPEFVVGML